MYTGLCVKSGGNPKLKGKNKWVIAKNVNMDAIVVMVVVARPANARIVIAKRNNANL